MKKKKVLIVDDEKLFTDLIKANLELTGKYEVMTENKGENAVFSARDFNPDIILVDIIMPGKSGPSVADELSNDEDAGDIPIVFLTAFVTTDRTVNQDVMIGDRPFLPKPISIDELAVCIDRYARK